MSLRVFPVLIKTAALLSLTAALASGCTVRINPPAPMVLSRAPVTVEPSKLAADYAAGITEADACYAGQRLYFYHLTVDRIVSAANTRYIAVGNMWFEPDYYSYLTNLGEGTVIDVAGQCQGYSNGRIVFRDCWVSLVGGAATTTRSGY